MKKILIILSILVVVGIIVYNLVIFFIIDKCLDSGGKWNYELSKCEGNSF